MGIAMLTARVIRKMPMMKPMMRSVGKAMWGALAGCKNAPFYLRTGGCKPLHPGCVKT